MAYRSFGGEVEAFKHPHDMPPSRFPPSPTLGDSSLLIGFIVYILIILGTIHVDAHDPNSPNLDKWFENLKSVGGGYCCRGVESKELDDSDWDTKDPHYRVRLNGVWYDVDASAVVKDRNPTGHALVWPIYTDVGGVRTLAIRCFLPGTMT